jgi:hypothetical protein
MLGQSPTRRSSERLSLQRTQTLGCARKMSGVGMHIGAMTDAIRNGRHEQPRMTTTGLIDRCVSAACSTIFLTWTWRDAPEDGTIRPFSMGAVFGLPFDVTRRLMLSGTQLLEFQCLSPFRTFGPLSFSLASQLRGRSVSPNHPHHHSGKGTTAAPSTPSLSD